jgi:Na+-translocating ferredoxin:NAD+ oxidoreductase subunit B
MSENIYERLRVFLDSIQSGFPATPTGVEIKILKKLFSPDEAELTMKLKAKPEEISSIATRTGMDESELAKKLEEMASKGLIFNVKEENKSKFSAFQFLVGIEGRPLYVS